MGAVQGSVCTGLISQLNSMLQLSVELENDTKYPPAAFEPKRNQYYARKIIEIILQDLPDDCEKMICVTDVDLCTPVLTFVYGEAQLNGKIAVVSTKRLRQEFYGMPQNDELLLERLVKECLHELGHCYGLVHCSSKYCVMYFSSNILNIDNKQSNYCVNCQNFLMTKVGKEEHDQE